jgi:predicted MFS family arabinose efflux permease
MAGDVGSVTGPVAGGMLVDSASYAAAFGLAAAVLSGAALLALISPETRAGSQAQPPAGQPVGGPDSRVR